MWKRITSSLAVLFSLGIIGASCVAKVDEPAATPDDADVADVADVEETCDAAEPGTATAEEAIAGDPDPVRDFPRRRERARCFRHCEEVFHLCMRHVGPGFERERRFRCQRRRDFCFSECRRRWE